MSDTRVQTQLLSGKVFVLVGIFLWFVFFSPQISLKFSSSKEKKPTTMICYIICILQVLFPLLVSVYKSKLLRRETSE